MLLNKALEIADRIKTEMAPHCNRIEVAGSVRRKSHEPGDIEIVCIPKPYDVGLFESGIATIINQWQIVRGDLPAKYTCRRLPEGIDIDIFFCTPDNWGFIYLIRTGSSDFSKRMAARWAARGYHGHEGSLWYTGKSAIDCTGVKNGKKIITPEEEDIFRICNVPFIKPEHRI
jgi:DNA polymerase/3'-5' exonuclease PolX